MFYKKEDVSDAITCGICSQTYKDPRVLPCGESACHECIVDVIQRNKEKKFECVFCKEMHHPSEFYSNKTALKLVGKKAEEVYRFKCYEDLKDKLGEMKGKFESVENSVDNGVSQIQEHCSQIKNEVYLRAEILIEQIHQITEGMITEIDEYEKDCVDSFNSKIVEYRKEFGKLLIEMKEFYNSTSNYMNEFKINEEVVERSLARVTDLTDKLKKQDLKKIKFNNRIIRFIRSTFEFKEKLIGGLEKEFLIFEEYKFENSDMEFRLLEHDDYGRKAVFNLDEDNNLEIELLDSDGKRVMHITNVLNIGAFFAVKSSHYYIFNTYYDKDSFSIFGNRFYIEEDDQEILILIDMEFNYLKHKVIDHDVSLIACNDSTIICVDSDENFNHYDMDLELVVSNPFEEFRRKNKAKIGEISNIVLNENNLFVLSDNYDKSAKLLIFDLNTFDFIKQIDVLADQIKLVSTSHLILFDSSEKMLFLYSQSGDFELLDEVDLSYLFENDNHEKFSMNKDASTTIHM
jgi:hypothetical protein